MRVAASSNGKNSLCDFSKVVKLVIFEVEKRKVRGRIMIDVSASGGDEALKYILKNEGVEVLLCGRITDETKKGLENQNIEVISEIQGNINNVLSRYMRK